MKNITYNRSEARKNLPSLVDKVKDSDSTVYISERGVKQAVLISYKSFKRNYCEKTQSEKLLEIAGIWKNRKDMKNSANWVSKLRKDNERKFK